MPECPPPKRKQTNNQLCTNKNKVRWSLKLTILQLGLFAFILRMTHSYVIQEVSYKWPNPKAAFLEGRPSYSGRCNRCWQFCYINRDEIMKIPWKSPLGLPSGVEAQSQWDKSLKFLRMTQRYIGVLIKVA